MCHCLLYCENHTNPTNKLCGQDVELIDIKACDKYNSVPGVMQVIVISIACLISAVLLVFLSPLRTETSVTDDFCL
jgi:hypothetical protein